MIICKTGPGLEYSQATCSPDAWSEKSLPLGYNKETDRPTILNWDYNNVTWQRKGQEIMILPPYEFCPEVCIANVYFSVAKSDPFFRVEPDFGPTQLFDLLVFTSFFFLTSFVVRDV